MRIAMDIGPQWATRVGHEEPAKMLCTAVYCVRSNNNGNLERVDNALVLMVIAYKVASHLGAEAPDNIPIG